MNKALRITLVSLNRLLGGPKSGAGRLRDLKVDLKHALSDFFNLSVGVLAASFGLKGFLIPNHFIDGGVMGISLIVDVFTDIPLSLLIFLFNLPFLALAFWAVNKRFAYKSILGIIMLSLAIYLIPYPAITQDKILVATFGGFFLGLGIGLAIRGGAIIDGTEVLAIYVSKKTSLSVGNVILIFNLFIFLTAAYVFTVQIALYAILTYFAASKTADFVIDGIEEYTGVIIISDHTDGIRQAIIERMHRGCTILKGEKGYSKVEGVHAETRIVYTVITRLEVARLKTEIDKVDPNAFLIMSSVKDTRGGMIKKTALKKIK
ncbi:YitT family protein [Roseivirga sp. BDSF3-8]|uniref:YitT family protein n=1 Tax=Roseivirga sp. BDSF3-8 TaxID=3241598 RepID=UPI003531F993